MRTLQLHQSVLKELDSLQAKQYRQVVSATLDLLKNPQPHYSQALSGSEYSRITVGEYRVIYRATDTTIYVLAFGKRNDDAIYKLLERRNI
jgi:mRNA interferase RelE/StbE